MPRIRLKSKIGKIFVNEKILEEYSVKIYEIDPYFHEHYKKTTTTTTTKKQLNENILFRIDAYFSEYFLAVQVDGKGHTDRDLLFVEKRQEALDKKLGCKFIGISTSKHYDEDYEIGIIQTFISKFKNRQSRKLEKE